MEAMINGIRMAYDDHGCGPAVLLIHGFPLSRKMWRPQVNGLTAAGFRVITPDLRGFGESEAPDGPYSIDLFADDLAELLDHLKLERAVVGGMSMGGYILFDLLERYPERVSAACFLTTRAGADDEAGRERRLALSRDVLKFGPQVVLDAFEKLLFADETLQERPKLVADVFDWMAENESRGMAGALLAMRERKDYLPLLPGFRIPALAVGADDDKAAPATNAQAIAEGIPGCRLEIVSHAGHMANLENPGTYNDALIRFLRDLG